ncbi:JAB domain-containing protein [Agathobaculum sp.]|uniref:JAB domain-containing protein n=1 Tax=Agathobaculum sp. TaxID=2048138 RepID=UPI002A8254B8|nr:JAB domain-containing protein [Agathobaculum sp.]MDY3617875.1 JAB domain-containing protein [Agathobaculum sp.]
MAGLHDNHRERVFKKFEEYGLDAFEDYQALELLLFYSIPRKDTNETAHRLKNTFGSLSGVFDASYEALLQVEGVGGRTAALVCLLRELAARVEKDRARVQQNSIRLTTPELIGAYFVPQFTGAAEERLLAAYLDNAGRVLRCTTVGVGNVNRVSLNMRGILESACLLKAAGVALAHNHPGGDVSPSAEDIELTKRVADGLRLADIQLVEHVIVAGDRFNPIGKLCCGRRNY